MTSLVAVAEHNATIRAGKFCRWSFSQGRQYLVRSQDEFFTILQVGEEPVILETSLANDLFVVQAQRVEKDAISWVKPPGKGL